MQKMSQSKVISWYTCIAVNAEKSKYIILSDSEVQKCANPSVTLCGIKSALYPINLKKLYIIALFMKNKPNVNMQYRFGGIQFC